MILMFYLPFLIIWGLVHLNKKVRLKHKFITAVVNLIFSLLWLLLSILDYGVSEATFEDKVRVYFSNDASMTYGLMILPNIIIGTVIPLIGLAIFLINRMMNKKGRE